MSEFDEQMMQRCIQLAKNGLGQTYPNPMVGCVITLGNEIIAESWHQKAGEPHAEVNAIQQLTDKSILKQSTLYVSLEPCAHFGKTPPCSDLIIQHEIPKVDRKSTRLNSSHVANSYAVFCLKKKKLAIG